MVSVLHQIKDDIYIKLKPPFQITEGIKQIEIVEVENATLEQIHILHPRVIHQKDAGTNINLIMQDGQSVVLIPNLYKIYIVNKTDTKEVEFIE